MAATFPNQLAIESSQLEQIRTLLGTILPSNRFYSRKLPVREITSLEDFKSRVPFTTKDELVADQRNQPPFGTNLTFPIQRYTRFHQTSGTEGAPLRWLDDRESWKWMVANWKRVFEAAGVTKSDRVLFAFSFGPFIGFWLAFEAATELGCLSFPTGGLSSSARLRHMLECEATVVCCTPTYALRLAEVAKEEDIDLSRAKVRLLMVAGEPGGSVPATRQELERLWQGARVFDHHGMTEVGPVTFECPTRPGVLHAFSDSYLAEVIEPSSGNPRPHGEAGELVLTTLGRIGSPVLRYRTGDLVRALSPAVCACGRSDLALEGGILSRVDDMIIVRGVNIYPSAVDEIIRATGRIAEYRVYVDTSGALTKLHIEVEPASNPGDLKETLERALDRAFSMRIPVQCVSAGSLPRFDLKARRWIRGAISP